MRNYWKLVQPGYLFSWPVFIPTYLWALLVHFSDSMMNQPGNYLARFFIVTSLHVFFFGFLYLSQILFLDRIKPNFVPIALVLAIILAGAIRGYIFQFWLFSWGFDEQQDAALRVKSSILNMTIAVMTSLIAYANSQRRNQIYSELIMENSRLELVRQDLKENFARETVESVTHELRARIEAIRGQDPRLAASGFRRIIEEIVSPLSRNLESNFTPWTPPLASRTPLKINWLEVLRESLLPANVSYKFVPFFLTFIASPIILANTALQIAAFQFALVITIGVLVGYLMQIITRRYGRNIWGFLLVTSSTGLSMGITSLSFTEDYVDPQGFLRPSVIYYVLISAIIAILNVAEQKRKSLTLELQRTIDELEWQIARVRESQRVLYRKFARFLHGPVQAKLTAILFSLQAGDASSSSSRTIDQMTIDVDQLLSSDWQDIEPIEFLSGVFTKVQETWQSLCDVRFEVNQEILALVESDPLCRSAIADVIPELVFNSIKHGRATEIDISLELQGEDLAKLRISDNGKAGKKIGNSGLGTRILDESSVFWNRTYGETRHVTTALFAFKARNVEPDIHS